MKKPNIEPNVTVIYNNNENARNKLIDYIINLLLESNVKDLIDERIIAKDRGDCQENG